MITHVPTFSSSMFSSESNFRLLGTSLAPPNASAMSTVYSKMEVEKLGSCVVIHMKSGENRLTPEFVKEFHECLDKAEA